MTNRLDINWKLDGFVDEQRYYCSSTPIDVNNLPTPKTVLNGDVRTYVDTAIELGKTYHVCVSSVRGSTEKLSQFIKMYAFNQSLFKINSNFEFDLTDKTGKVWTKYGNAQISSNMLQLNGNGDYLTTPASGDCHFTNSEDVTIRFKVKINSFKASNIATVFSTWNTNASNGYGIRLLPNGLQLVMWNIAFVTMFSYTVPLNTEIEISLERKGMQWRLYVDGEQKGSASTQPVNYAGTLPPYFYLGSGVYEGYGSTRDLNGSIRYFQVIKGLAIGDGKSTTARI